MKQRLLSDKKANTKAEIYKTPTAVSDIKRKPKF